MTGGYRVPWGLLRMANDGDSERRRLGQSRGGRSRASRSVRVLVVALLALGGCVAHWSDPGSSSLDRTASDCVKGGFVWHASLGICEVPER